LSRWIFVLFIIPTFPASQLCWYFCCTISRAVVSSPADPCQDFAGVANRTEVTLSARDLKLFPGLLSHPRRKTLPFTRFVSMAPQDIYPTRFISEMPQTDNNTGLQTVVDAPPGGSAQGSSVATSTPRDTTSPSTDGLIHDSMEAGSWKGWAELENDPVRAFPSSVYTDRGLNASSR
jgi:hypothetical protein